jgi:hypothetical protein
MIKTENVKDFYDMINEDEYKDNEQVFILLVLNHESLYYSRSSQIFLYYAGNFSAKRLTKEEGFKLLNIELRKYKLEKICSKLETK